MSTSKIEVTIDELSKDLGLPDNFNKSEFLAICTYKRIEESTEKYDRQFDHYLSLVESNELSYKDLHRLSSSLKSLSSLINSSYDGLLSMIENCKAQFFSN